MILTRDEEHNLPRALTSLPRGMAIFVLDALSRDRTLDHARAAGATIVQRPWSNFVDARRFALAQVTTPWILILDADEALDDRLRDAIGAASDEANGYMVRRTTYFCGKILRMWRDEPLLRLFRTDRARIEAYPTVGGSAALHERVLCDGRVAQLAGTLLHYSYPDMLTYRTKFARYTAIEAGGVRGSLRKALGASALVPIRGMLYLLRQNAWLDGPRGWYVAIASACYPAAVAWKALRQ